MSATKTTVSRRQLLLLTPHKIHFRLELCPGPHWRLQLCPNSWAEFEGR